jgi:hypothetical protein
MREMVLLSCSQHSPDYALNMWVWCISDHIGNGMSGEELTESWIPCENRFHGGWLTAGAHHGLLLYGVMCC